MEELSGRRLSRRVNCLDTLINGFSALFRLDQNDRDGSIILFRATMLVFTQRCPATFFCILGINYKKLTGENVTVFEKISRYCSQQLLPARTLKTCSLVFLSTLSNYCIIYLMN